MDPQHEHIKQPCWGLSVKLWQDNKVRSYRFEKAPFFGPKHKLLDLRRKRGGVDKKFPHTRYWNIAFAWGWFEIVVYTPILAPTKIIGHYKNMLDVRKRYTRDLARATKGLADAQAELDRLLKAKDVQRYLNNGLANGPALSKHTRSKTDGNFK